MTDKLYCPRGAGPDSPFQPPMNGEMHWREDHTCSHCGSLSEEEFFRLVEEGALLGPTDKNYKVYVNRQKKFYLQHLSPEGRTKFIELHNAKKMNIGDPGYFYVPPFFASPVK